MSWTAGALAHEMALETGVEWTDEDNQALLLSWVNEAYSIVTSYYDWFWLRQEEDITIAAAASSFALLSSAVQPVWVGIASPIFKELILVDSSDMAGIDTTVTGQPRYCWIKSFAADVLTLGFWPVADQQYTFHIQEVVKPSILASETTLPVPEEFISMIKEYVRNLRLRKEGDYFGARASKDEVIARLEMMKRKTNIPKAKRLVFAVSDVKSEKDPRLPNLPGNYPDY